MGKAIYTGVNGVARTVKQPWVGVKSVARKVTNGYSGVSGVARQFWPSITEYKWNRYNTTAQHPSLVTTTANTFVADSTGQYIADWYWFDDNPVDIFYTELSNVSPTIDHEIDSINGTYKWGFWIQNARWIFSDEANNINNISSIKQKLAGKVFCILNESAKSEYDLSSGGSNFYMFDPAYDTMSLLYNCTDIITYNTTYLYKPAAGVKAEYRIKPPAEGTGITTVQGSYKDQVTSTNRNAYPDNGISGSYWYVYAGTV